MYPIITNSLACVENRNINEGRGFYRFMIMNKCNVTSIAKNGAVCNYISVPVKFSCVILKYIFRFVLVSSSMWSSASCYCYYYYITLI